MENNLTMWLLTCAVAVPVAFSLGFALGVWLMTRWRPRVPAPYAPQEEVVKVKRTKPSLRNPLRPYEERYDDFKTKRNLYAPVKPSGKPGRDELEA